MLISAPPSGRKAAIVFLAAVVVLLVSALSARAQVTDEMLQKASEKTGLSKDELLRMYQSGAIAIPAPAESAQVAPGRSDTLLPGLPVLKAPPPPVRHVQSGTPALFGADFFKLQPGVFTQSSFGPVPEDYVIGPGDQIFVDVWGEVEFRVERVVDRDGSIILPKGGMVVCAGLTLAELKRSVREHLAAAYSGISLDPEKGNTFLDVSLGKLRAIRVYVIGDAVQPGAYDLSSMATIFTAIYAAGGPSDTGSMRDIRLVRGNQVVAHLDFYAYLLQGDRSNDVILREYDTVFIPPRGPTVELSGEVRRPLRFELKSGEDLVDLVRFGSGFTATAATGVLHILRTLPPAERLPGQPDRVQVDVLMDPGSGKPRDSTQASLLDGDVVRVDAITNRMDNWVQIKGAVKQPGRYEYVDGMDVAALIALAGQTWPDRLGARGIIDRNLPDGRRVTLRFPLDDVLSGKQIVPVSPMDSVQVFSRWDIEDRFTVSITGQVRHPQTTEYREQMTLADLMLKAGGLLESADQVQAEVSRLRLEAVESQDESKPPGQTVDLIEVPLGADWLQDARGFALEPHDQVAIRQLPWWQIPQTVILTGEELYAGVYTLQNDKETLSDVLVRAKGLKPTAFLAGAHIIRKKDSVGNIAIDLQCALDHPHQECDPMLVAGDSINVPTQPQTVKVTGAVGHPTSIPFQDGRSLSFYVNHAGGYAEGANRWKTQVIYPNGMSRNIRRFWRDPSVEPGSTILVPVLIGQKKDHLETAEKILSIIASAATTYLVIDRTLPAK